MQVKRTWKQNLKSAYHLLCKRELTDDLAYILYRIRKVYFNRYQEYL